MKRHSTGMLVASLVAVTACGAGTGAGAPNTVAPSGTSSEAASGTTVGDDTEELHTAATDLGTIVVDPGGYTLYMFTADTDAESTCYDACADLWPPVAADTPIGSDLDPSLFGTTTRTDGTEQLTVGGRPLYRYTPDTNPGDTAGHGFNDVWFAVGADGAMIGAPDATTTTTTGGGGYNY